LAKPIVNGIEKQLKDRAHVVRLSMLSKLGQQVAGDFEVVAVPTTLIFDGAGNICYRHAGLPDRQAILEHVAAVEKSSRRPALNT
jgi:hypothetical protein